MEFHYSRMDMAFQLVTERLILRDFTKQDIEPYLAQCRDQKYQRFYSEEECTDQHAEALVHLFILQSCATPRTHYQLVIEEAVSGSFVGTVGLRCEGDRPDIATVGCGLDREFHSSGYALEAAEKLIEFGFSTLSLSAVEADTNSENHAAIKLCRLLGLQVIETGEKTQYFKGRWWSRTLLAMTREQWLAQRVDTQTQKSIDG